MPQLRVLVCDDDKDAVASLILLLREEGHEVRGVYSGHAVLDRVRDFGPDVVLLDIGMPQISGYEVARELRARLGAGLRLIALTGWGAAGDVQRAREAGFDHHLTKPADPGVLSRMISPA